MRKLAYLTYGSIAYMLFFGVFVYMIGWVTGLVVPYTIDTGKESPLTIALLINLGLVALFGVQHSVMARPSFKRWWTQFVPKEIERSTFVLLTAVILALLMWQWRTVDITLWNIQTDWSQALITGVAMAGFGLVLITTFIINHFDLFGLRQVWLAFRGKEYRHVGFKMPLLYKLVRHPLYLGFIIAFWATPTMTLSHFIFAASMTAYIFVGIYFEERTLTEELGDTYVQWKERTPKLIPKLTPTTLEPDTASTPNASHAA